MHTATVSALAGILEVIKQSVRTAESILAAEASVRQDERNLRQHREETQEPAATPYLGDEAEQFLGNVLRNSFKEAQRDLDETESLMRPTEESKG